MRERFRAFYPLSDAERDEAWEEGLIVLDTNALLSLYRYPLDARNDLLAVLDGFKERLWLPYQVALEYHRNLPAVLRDQRARFKEVRDEIAGMKSDSQARINKLRLRKRHALIDAEGLREEIETAIDRFLEKLNVIEREREELYQEDTLQGKIEVLFEGRIGEAPKQEWLDSVYEEGASRFDKKIPPGYKDAHKEASNKEADTYTFGGVVFQRKFGDLVIWKEVLQRVKQEKIQWLIFVTDDSKEDWWLSREGRKIGPRPALVDEAGREGGLRGLVMQTSENFVAIASKKLGVEVTEEVIQQISIERRAADDTRTELDEPGFLEKIASAEAGLEELTQVSGVLTTELNRVQEIMELSTRKLKAAKDIRMRARFTNETASQIDAASVSFEKGVVDFETCLAQIEPGVDFIIDHIDELESRGEPVPEVKEVLLTLFRTIVETIGGAEVFDGVLAGIPDATAALRSSIRGLRSAIHHYISVAGRVNRWIEHWD